MGNFYEVVLSLSLWHPTVVPEGDQENFGPRARAFGANSQVAEVRVIRVVGVLLIWRLFIYKNWTKKTWLFRVYDGRFCLALLMLLNMADCLVLLMLLFVVNVDAEDETGIAG